jgi:hypothetical protein
MCRQRNTGRGRGLFGAAEKRNAKGVLSFGDFSLHKQRKVTRSPKASGSLCLRVTRSAEGRMEALVLQKKMIQLKRERAA